MVDRIHYFFIGKALKPELAKILSKHLAGLARAPAMSFGKVDTSLAELNLSNYEISPTEPLHDLKGHIRNVWELLPKHLPERGRQIFEEELKLALGKYKID